MAMSKQDFIALADAVRPLKQLPDSCLTPEYIEQELANFCQSRNPRFMRDRWLEYIAGNCGPNGGKPKRNAFEEVERGFYSRKNGGGR